MTGQGRSAASPRTDQRTGAGRRASDGLACVLKASAPAPGPSRRAPLPDASLPMPDLFSPYTLKGVTLRNRIAMSPMTMYNSVDGKLDDYHVSYLGARAAGGFGLVFGEQMAITPDGRTTTSCAGIWDDAQIEGPRPRLRHRGADGRRAGHPTGPHGPQGQRAAAPTRGPTCAEPGSSCRPTTSMAGNAWRPRPFPTARPRLPVRELTVEDIAALHRSYADAARRALAAGYKWLEMHYAHGYLGASFFPPLANQRTDRYGGSVENRVRFHLEALDAVRCVWPEEYPLTMRLGSDDLHPEGVQFDDSILAIPHDEGARARPRRPEPRLRHRRDDRSADERGRLHAEARQPGPPGGRHPGGDELEAGRARQRRPGDPRGTHRPRVPRPLGAGPTRTGPSGRRASCSTTIRSTSCRRTGPGGSATSAAAVRRSACRRPRARPGTAGPPDAAAGRTCGAPA